MKKDLRLKNHFKSEAKSVRLNARSPHNKQRLAFNLSFVTSNRKYNFSGKHFDKSIKNKFVEKMIRLSNDDLVTILGWSKESGIENLPDHIVKLAVNSEFVASGRAATCLTGMWIFRLAKSGRVIGKIKGTTFYVLAIDTTFDLYQHG
ncbi:hypothetical protein [Levilactobacillus yiduensis]|uniref:hypothetical protein n=1 Tax=Levilactobacillus yiduensis TaxID=2953880 RepID=UPI000EF2B883|nr:hypothetical protein [Levilactobacillus yiduensis]AYM02129.1 hypothetical protein D8911_03660 [Levilactobacillus brevis]